MRLLFVELLAFWSPKLSVRNALEKPVFTATFVMPLRPTVTVTSVKVTWNEGPDQALQRKPPCARNYAAYAV